MRILHIDETFYPTFGYQCMPLSKFQSKAGNEVYIITQEVKYIYGNYIAFGEHGQNYLKDDKQFEEQTGVNIVRVHAKGYIAGRLNYDMKELYAAIDRIHPDVIMVHCIETLTAMRLMRTLKRKYPMVFDSHMLAMATRNKFSRVYEFFYRMIFARIVKRENYTVIKTQDDDYVVTHLGIPEKQTKFISFGTDTELFCPKCDEKTKFLSDKGLPDNTFIIVSTGKLGKAKDGMLLADTVKEKFNSDRPVAVVIVADFGGEYEKGVKEMLDRSENNVFYYPVQKYLSLPWFYQIADVTVFPKQCSMSFYDAQSCGSPVISEKGHVNEERNSHGNGLCFECSDKSDFRAKLEQMMNMHPDEYQKMRDNCRHFITANYSYDKIAAEYTAELVKEKENFHEKYGR